MGTSSRSLLRTLGRSFCTTAGPTHRNNHQHTHKVLDPNSFVGSWEAPRTPKEAEKRLAQLRRDYAKVKETRKGYIHEMELFRLEKLRKDQAKQEALQLANEERKKLEAEAAKVRAEERKVAQEEFRQTLMKERTERNEFLRQKIFKGMDDNELVKKLQENFEYWGMKEKLRRENKKEKKELLHRKTCTWIEENEIVKKSQENLEYWRMKEKLRRENKKEKNDNELLHQNNSMRIEFRKRNAEELLKKLQEKFDNWWMKEKLRSEQEREE